MYYVKKRETYIIHISSLNSYFTALYKNII